MKNSLLFLGLIFLLSLIFLINLAFSQTQVECADDADCPQGQVCQRLGDISEWKCLPTQGSGSDEETEQWKIRKEMQWQEERTTTTIITATIIISVILIVSLIILAIILSRRKRK